MRVIRAVLGELLAVQIGPAQEVASLDPGSSMYSTWVKTTLCLAKLHLVRLHNLRLTLLGQSKDVLCSMPRVDLSYISVTVSTSDLICTSSISSCDARDNRSSDNIPHNGRHRSSKSEPIPSRHDARRHMTPFVAPHAYPKPHWLSRSVFDN